MADKKVTIILAGSSAGAVKAFEETSAAADLAAKESGSKFEAMGGRLSGVFTKLGQAGEKFGLPFAGALTGMGEKMEATGGKATGMAGLLSSAAVPTLALAAAATVVGVEAFKLGTEMQAADAAIAAHAGISTAAAKAIGDAFLDTAGKSTFSGKEMADAFAPVAGQLGMVQGAALTAAQSTQVMQAASDLAEASGTDLNTTTASLATVMQAYSIKASGAAGASNTLWNVARLTGNGIDTVATVVDKLHKNLGQVVPSLSDTGALMVELAEKGATGTRGTQVLATGMNTLLGGSKATSVEIHALGVHLFDASGKFVGMGSVIDQLGPKLAGMSQAQQLAAEKALFGASAGQLLGQVMLAGGQAFDTATAAVQRHGAVEDAARMKSSTLEGETKMLKSTLEDLGTKLGEALIPILEKVAKVVSEVVGWFMQHKAVAIALAAVLADVLTGGISTLVIAIIALAKNWSTIWGGIKSVFDTVWHGIETGIRAIVDVFLNMVGTIIHGAADAFGWVPGIGGKLKDASKAFDSFKTSVDATLGDTNAQLSQAVANLDAFNQKAAQMGSSLRQVGAGAALAGQATFQSTTSGVKMAAAGELITSAALRIVGEAGPEVILPLNDMSRVGALMAQAQPYISGGVSPTTGIGSLAASYGGAGSSTGMSGAQADQLIGLLQTIAGTTGQTADAAGRFANGAAAVAGSVVEANNHQLARTMAGSV